MTCRLQEEAPGYCWQAPAGKLAIAVTKLLATQRGPSLAYSPRVAARERIVVDRVAAAQMTIRTKLVAADAPRRPHDTRSTFLARADQAPVTE